MCGLTGITFNVNTNTYDRYNKRFDQAYQYIKNRGPDDKGIWHDDFSYFLHSRLSIIDLKRTSSQPMEFEDHVICYNGEIYNFIEIRKILLSKGHFFKTNGDTEVILKAWLEWGKNMLPKLDGMFAFSIWNKKEKTLFLARDRFGKKPLVYSLGKNYIAFSSDIRSLEKIAESGEIDSLAIESLFRFRFIREPITIYKNFKKLPPGSFLIFNKYGAKINKWYELKRKENLSFEKEKLNQNVRDLVFKAVEKRLVSDAPLGLFLSSGLDSGIILAALSSIEKKIPCFTIGFSENRNYYDESENASKIAKHFGAKHEKIILSSKSILSEIENILDACDEPFADSSAISMFMVSKAASNYLKVALTGDGGDETFGGYRKYISYKWSPFINLIPGSIRNIISHKLPNTKKNNATDFSRKIRRLLINSVKDESRMQLNFLDQLSENEYISLFGYNKNENKNSFTSQKITFLDNINSILYKDFEFSLLGDMLVKIDRCSMANSIEIRSPFLDRELVDYIFNVPGKYKVGFFSGKLLIKDAFESIIPKWHMKIPKKGFEVPIENWLRKDLRYLVDEATKKKVIESLPIRDPKIIRKWKEDFLNGKNDNSWKMWTLITYSKWAKKNNII